MGSNLGRWRRNGTQNPRRTWAAGGSRPRLARSDPAVALTSGARHPRYLVDRANRRDQLVADGEHYIDNCPDVLEADARMEAMEADYEERHPEAVELD